jgi:hypothetical protein
MISIFLGINGATTFCSIITTNYIFYWNENFDYALMNILKKIGIHDWSMLFHCSTLFIIQILL